jgi:predicted permease
MSWRDEMESHIAMRAEINERAGMTPGEARRAAERAFGNRGQIGEEVRAVSIPLWLEQLGQDLRYAVRGLRRSPAFTIAAVAALTIGIGASTAVFSFVDRILFRPLPYSNEKELVWFGMTAPIGGGSEFVIEENYVTWRRQGSPFSAITATSGGDDCSLSELNPVRLRCAAVDSNFLSLFGYRPVVGRDFNEEDTRDGAPRVVLISRALWMDRFGGRDIRGQSIEIDSVRREVIGVLPEDFEMPQLTKIDVLMVLQIFGKKPPNAGSLLLTAFARLKPAMTTDMARAQMEPYFQAALETVPRGFRKEVKLVVHPLRDRQVRDSTRSAWLLIGAVGLLLLIAIANVANLLLARAAARQRELAVRVAIGAGRARLARQLFTESFALAGVGGILGIAFAWVLLRMFQAIAPAGILRLNDAAIDWRVAVFAAGASMAASILFGAAPAIRAPKPGRRRDKLRPTLVISQIALALVLLCGATLLARSLRNMASAPLGMETGSVFTAFAQLPGARYPDAASRATFWRQVEERVAAAPGVEKMALSESMPPEGRAESTIFSRIAIEGRPQQSGQATGGTVIVRRVTPAYFQILGIPMRTGRALTDSDTNAVVLSERLAARLKLSGERIGFFAEPMHDVIGAAGEVRNAGLRVDSDPEMYTLTKREQRRMFVVVRGSPSAMPFVRGIFQELDPRLIVELETLDDRVGRLRTRPRFQSMLLAGFAVSGLLLSAIGLYGVMALLTAQRTGEIGIRMALGATSRNIGIMIAGQAGRWTAAGIVIGLCGAAVSAKWIEGLLFGVSVWDPLPLMAAILTLVAAAFVAAWLPARRAARIEPVQALREL